MIMEIEIGVVEGGKRKVTQDSGDTRNRNDESYKFQTTGNITKESQVHLEQIERTWKLEAMGIKSSMMNYQDEKALGTFGKLLTKNKDQITSDPYIQSTPNETHV
ncbi:hypothetical protein LOAG_14629 [Loa loa]|nr:hypothetical protein LOAG_14629 [Loa loa]EFO13898.1 hypothetical protein LOAG_14629 [Loa loa]